MVPDVCFINTFLQEKIQIYYDKHKSLGASFTTRWEGPLPEGNVNCNPFCTLGIYLAWV